eukprot:Clim_evm56s236 gene=Clim_evmTU56s236
MSREALHSDPGAVPGSLTGAHRYNVAALEHSGSKDAKTRTAAVTQPVPEYYEQNQGESLDSRLAAIEQMHGLGPPDMCHVSKSITRQGGIFSAAETTNKGTYHYIHGLDVTSGAAIAAYFTSLLAAPRQTEWPVRGEWKIQGGTYCSYNAFTRTDVRVEITMPGSVLAYGVNNRGDRFETTERTWQELWISAVLRWVDRPNPFVHHVDCLRTFDPFDEKSSEQAFLKAAAEMFWEGVSLGSSEPLAIPDNVNNRLTQGLRRFFMDTGRYADAIDFFAQFVDRDAELQALIAEAEDNLNRRTQSLCTLARTLKEVPESANLLVAEGSLLVHAGQMELAESVSRYAADTSPGRSSVWLNLARVYLAREMYEDCLVALNVTPMNSSAEFFIPDMPPAARRMHDNTAVLDMIEQEEDGDEALFSLLGPNLKENFLEAYTILADIVKKTGWDQLLAFRSKVFVMEEEYVMSTKELAERKRKATEQRRKHTPHEGSPEGKPRQGQRTVSESSEEQKPSTQDDSQQKEQEDQQEEPQEQQETTNAATVDKPDGTTAEEEARGSDQSNKEQLERKRLCERWLDHIFMALYKDLRQYSLWKAQEARVRQGATAQERTVGDMLRLGQLAERLLREEDALRCYAQCVEIAYSLRAWCQLTTLYIKLQQYDDALAAVGKVFSFYSMNRQLMVPQKVLAALNQMVVAKGLKYCTENIEAVGDLTPGMKWALWFVTRRRPVLFDQGKSGA